MALRRGFKSEAERIARIVRTELSKSAARPLCPKFSPSCWALKSERETS